MVSAHASTSPSDLFSGKKRARLVPTLALAVLVTALVAIPLILVAMNAQDNPTEAEVFVVPADAALVMFDTGATEPQPLDLATVSGGVLISLFEESASAVSFGLYAAGSDEAIVQSQDLVGPQFDLLLRDSGGGKPLLTSYLLDGEYELYVTIRTVDEERRTALTFTVDNS